MRQREGKKKKKKGKLADSDTGDSLIFHEPICESMAICVLHSALI